jgi:hypothetical protein
VGVKQTGEVVVGKGGWWGCLLAREGRDGESGTERVGVGMELWALPGDSGPSGWRGSVGKGTQRVHAGGGEGFRGLVGGAVVSEHGRDREKGVWRELGC